MNDCEKMETILGIKTALYLIKNGNVDGGVKRLEHQLNRLIEGIE